MRITEFQSLNEHTIGDAIHEVIEGLAKDSPGMDHARLVRPGSPTHRLLMVLLQRVAAREAEYGLETGIMHGLMMAFRIGAAYGRRVPAPDLPSRPASPVVEGPESGL